MRKKLQKMTTREEALLPCPFCGDDNAIQAILEKDSYWKCIISCGNPRCDATLGDIGQQKNEAVVNAKNLWNTRALSPPPDEVVKALEMAKFDLELLHEKEKERCVIASRDMAVKLEPITPPSLRYINKALRNHAQGKGEDDRRKPTKIQKR